MFTFFDREVVAMPELMAWWPPMLLLGVATAATLILLAQLRGSEARLRRMQAAMLGEMAGSMARDVEAAVAARLELLLSRRAEPAPELTPRWGHGELVLLAEDDAAVRETAADALLDMGFRVCAAADGDAALALLRHEPGISLVFSDIDMPGGINGVELARAVRRERPGIGVVLASGNGCNAAELPSGAMFLPKPYSLRQLAQAINVSLRA